MTIEDDNARAQEHVSKIKKENAELYKQLTIHIGESLETHRLRNLPPHVTEVLVRSNLQSPENLENLSKLATNKLKDFNSREIPTDWISLLATVRIILVLKNCAPISSLDEALIVGGSQISTTQRSIIDTLFSRDNAGDNGSSSAYTILDPVCSEKTVESKNPRICRDADIDLLVTFQQEIDKQSPQPLLFPHLVADWPACTKWKDLNYLVRATNGGKRQIPIEIGSSYTSDNWTQKLIPFNEFVQEYLLQTSAAVGYMAQYNILDHISTLKSDIYVPDICYVDTTKHEYPRPTVTALYYNVWIGPQGTISPLHTDPYFNLFCQVVGYKYIRLYPPERSNLYPRSTDNGIDMSNTSQVDLDKGLNDAEYRSSFPDFPWDTGYFECLLRPGDCLFIPKDWWHFVESKSISMSVSIWF